MRMIGRKWTLRTARVRYNLHVYLASTLLIVKHSYFVNVLVFSIHIYLQLCQPFFLTAYNLPHSIILDRNRHPFHSTAQCQVSKSIIAYYRRRTEIWRDPQGSH